MLFIIHLFIVAFFVLLGFLFRKGKGAFLIAGYNTASKAEREKIDETKLCKHMSRLMFILAACWLIIALSAVFSENILLWIGFGAFLFAVIFGVVYINTGNRIGKD